MRSFLPLFSLVCSFTLCQCVTTSSTTPTATNEPSEPAAPANRTISGIDVRHLNRLNEGGSEANISVPILRAPELEKRWGKPQLSVDSDGSYALHYSNPQRRFQHLVIYGSPQTYAPAGPVPPDYIDMKFIPGTDGPTTGPVSQTWKTVPLFGRTVRYYVSSPDSGADVAELTTETFTLTGPDGRTGSYCLSGGSDLNSGPLSIPAVYKFARF